MVRGTAVPLETSGTDTKGGGHSLRVRESAYHQLPLVTLHTPISIVPGIKTLYMINVKLNYYFPGWGRGRGGTTFQYGGDPPLKG